jgi:hypothetical protein
VRTWSSIFLFLLVVTGCTSTPPVESPQVTPATIAPRPPEPPFVAGRVVHTVAGERLRVRLGLRGRWSLSSVVPDGDAYLVTDDRYFEGTLGMHRLDAHGRLVSSWASTGPALPGPGRRAVWVSLVAPESGETGPTLIHSSNGVQDIGPLLAPSLTSYDGEVVTFTALRKEGRRYVRRVFTTDLRSPHFPQIVR